MGVSFVAPIKKQLERFGQIIIQNRAKAVATQVELFLGFNSLKKHLCRPPRPIHILRTQHH